MLPGLVGIHGGLGASSGGGGAGYPGIGLSPDAGIVAAAFATLSGTTATIQSQKNVASISNFSTGGFTVNVTSALTDAFYFALVGVRSPGAASEHVCIGLPSRATGANYSTTALDITIQEAGNVKVDPSHLTVVICRPGALTSAKYLAAAMFTASGSSYTIQSHKNASGHTREAAGVLRHTYDVGLSTTHYSMFVNSRYPLAGTADDPYPSMSGNSSFSSLHGTASAVANYGKYNSGASIFDVLSGGFLAFDPTDPPPGTLGAARLELSGGAVSATYLSNVASVVDNGAGYFSIIWALALPSANYGVLTSAATVPASGDNNTLCSAPARISGSVYSTTQLDIATQLVGTNTLTDGAYVDVWAFDPSAM